MKILDCWVENFGSYEELHFDFSNRGLAIIYGATGSGKSTLLSVPKWIIFGETDKGVNVDEVKNWGQDTVKGCARVQTASSIIAIHRIRGKTSSQNDLFWVIEGDETKTPQRGKDLADTQKSLEILLGVTYDSFVAACVYSEFSPSHTFFTDSAKNRRELLEKITNLRFPILIGAKVVDQKKLLKKQVLLATQIKSECVGKIKGSQDNLETAKRDQMKWTQDNKSSIDLLEQKCIHFEKEYESTLNAYRTKSEAFEKQREDDLTTVTVKIHTLAQKISKMDAKRCPSCGNTRDPIDFTIEQKNSAISQLESIKSRTNVWEVKITEHNKTKESKNAYMEQLKILRSKKNPITSLLEGLKDNITAAETELHKADLELCRLNEELSTLEQLYNLSIELRALLLKTSINTIETVMNQYLDRFFDSTIRVSLILEDLDSLQVQILKEGHSCSFKQLSKGQRNMLKLVFALAIMEQTAAKIGTQFGTLLLDEPTDGLDTELKIKSSKLFEELATKYDSVLVIEHSEELKALFNNKLEIKLTEKGSVIYEN